ncbi:Cna B-type domain-containing protein [Erysipelothrix rhusiopathiae]|nr:Cna B-type domain-containing protein [Erysipelothrix rhusiopathiae]
MTVTKEWKDDQGNLIEPPVDKIKVGLYKDGMATNEVKELNAENKWTQTFEKLPVSSNINTEDHEYMVKELGINGEAIEQNSRIQLDGKWFGVHYKGNMKDGYTITNEKEKPIVPLEPSLRTITVTKEWKDDQGNLIEPPVDKIKVGLYKDGMATNEVKELNAENKWTQTFEKLPVSSNINTEDHEYMVKELGINGEAIEQNSRIQLDGKWFDVSYSHALESTLLITNYLNSSVSKKEQISEESIQYKSKEILDELPHTGVSSRKVAFYGTVIVIVGLTILLMKEYKIRKY